MDKEKLLAHIGKSDLTGSEKIFLEKLLNDVEHVNHGKWNVTWKCHNYHEMDSGDYAYQYSECMVHVTCSICGNDSGSFKWNKSGKGKAGIDGFAYKMQVAEMNALKTKYCPNCGAKMDKN